MPGEGAFRRGRYRVRTWLRVQEPGWLYARWPVPKGAADCENHEFYNADDVIERCYDCEVGIRSRAAVLPPLASAEAEGIA